MEWFEYIIIIIAIGLVVLPIFLSIKNKKKGKSSCCGSCNSCGLYKSCCNSLKAYKIDSEKQKAKTITSNRN